MEFHPSVFLQKPTIEEVNNLTKVKLVALCDHLKVEIKRSWKKQEVKNVLISYLVDEGTLDKSDIQYVTTSDTGPSELQLRIREIELRKLEMELQIKHLEVSNQDRQKSPPVFDVSRHIRLVPSFSERDVDEFFVHFEKIAASLKWPKEYWVMLIQSVLNGKAREVYTHLSIEDSSNYDILKASILKMYELVPEAYRQKFRSFKKPPELSYMEFAPKKAHLFEKWCASKNVNDFNSLRELVMIEEFKRCVPPDLKLFLEERDLGSLDQIAKLSDDYVITHKWANKTQSTTKKVSGQITSQVTPPSPKGRDMPFPRTDNKPSSPQNDGPFCNYCKQSGHLLSTCIRLKRKQEKAGGVPTGFVSKIPGTETEPDGIMQLFKPFLSNGSVALVGGDVSASIRVLRDTGGGQSMILSSVLPFSSKSSTGQSVLVKGIEGIISPAELHVVDLKTDITHGRVTVAVRDMLPFENVDFLLGNDLAGDKVFREPIVSPIPCSEKTMDVEEKHPYLFPSCAVTRSMSKKQTDVTHDSNDFVGLSNTFFTQIDDNVKMVETSEMADKTHQDSDETEKLSKAQKSDSEIGHLFANVVSESEIDTYPVCYYIINGILMRKWRPPTVPAGDIWAVHHQIVVPKPYRKQILQLAHDVPLAGHLGVRKTYDKILSHFYWPRLKTSVSNYCKSCHTCQMAGKPNQIIPKAKLQPIPVLHEPFSHILIDCVGPLPKTRSGNQYMLTIMCTATRFPEAIPIRNIKAKTILKELTKFFTTFGLAKTVQSDQGSNFMSGVFQQVMQQLNISQIKSSAYHPESQGALERFHQTLKSMIKKYCLESEKDWDDGIPLLLFAARDSVQESLGFSPFDLVFGHPVRGPLKLLKEKFLSADKCLNLLKYVTDFRHKLLRATELAKESLKSVQDKMKAHYDKKAIHRSFEPGEKVLVFLPVVGSQLQARYHGPYIISRKVSDLNYVVETPDRRKSCQFCHVNMMKKYFTRSDESHPVGMSVSEGYDQTMELDIVNDEISMSFEDNAYLLNNIDVKLNHLDDQQAAELKSLLLKYKHLFAEVPSQTKKIYHDVDVGKASSVRQHPYRLNPEKSEFLRKEVQYLLEHDFIEPSDSDWCSPVVLVKKANGSYRMCSDYRKLNSVTKSDSFPIPRIDDCIDKIGNAKYISKFDLLKGFWQIPLTDRAKRLSAFVTPEGLYQYKVMPFGMKNSPATFQRLINSTINGIKDCEAYIDDIVCHSETWQEHLSTIEELFIRLGDAELTVNLTKCEFVQACVTFLGHKVGFGTVRPIDLKVQAISEFPVPQNKKDVMRFLGVVGYYRRFCQNFSIIANPMTNLLCKKNSFRWDGDCQKAFDKLKAILYNSPVLIAPNFNIPFKLYVDASDIGAGGVLMQEDDSSIDHPVAFFSKKFNKHQKNYSTIEKECLALILSIQHFECYLNSADHISVFSDHNPLTFLHKMKNNNQRLMRWCIALQPYDVIVKHIRGKDNLIADSLSRFT